MLIVKCLRVSSYGSFFRHRIQHLLLKTQFFGFKCFRLQLGKIFPGVSNLFCNIVNREESRTKPAKPVVWLQRYTVLWKVFIHSVFCLTTGPKPPPKRFFYIVRWEYPLLSLRSSSGFLLLLPRLLVTSISLFIFPNTAQQFDSYQEYLYHFQKRSWKNKWGVKS